MRICSNCGKQLKDEAKFCNACGTRCEAEIQNKSVQNQPFQSQPVQNQAYQKHSMQSNQPVQQEKKKSTAPWIALIIMLFIILIALIGVAVVLIFGNPFAKEDTVAEVETQEETSEEMQSSMEEESEEVITEPETETVEEEEDNDSKELDHAKRMNGFNDILTMFVCGLQLPDEEAPYMDLLDGDLHQNTYAITDIDGDGEEELLIQITETNSASMMLKVYDMDESKYGQKQAYVCEFSEYPSIKAYDNGVILVDLSHNQGLGESIWPYTLYTYDKESDTYEKRGSAECWDKSYRDEDFDGKQFPDELDKDEDGTIYYVTDLTKGDDMITMDNEEYDAWLNSYIGEGSEIDISWSKFDNYDFGSYAKDYVDTYIRIYDEKNHPENTNQDMGRLFMENNEFDQVIDVMKDSGVDIEENSEEDDDEDYGVTGTKDGEDVFYVYYDDNGGFQYINSKVEEISVLGIYPGMDEKEAISILTDCGFYSVYEDYYITGDGTGNYGIGLRCENGKVESISMSQRNGYAG